MSTRSSLVPAVASGGATAVKLLVATLAFTGAYVGVEAAHTAAGRASTASASVQLTPLSARSLPLEEAARPEPGTVVVSPSSGAAAGAECRRTYRAQSVVTGADGIAIYHWRLVRWSAASHKWQPYMAAPAGFAGDTRAVEWRPHIVANPGWYRIELKVQPGGTYSSDRFQVTC